MKLRANCPVPMTPILIVQTSLFWWSSWWCSPAAVVAEQRPTLQDCVGRLSNNASGPFRTGRCSTTPPPSSTHEGLGTSPGGSLGPDLGQRLPPPQDQPSRLHPRRADLREARPRRSDPHPHPAQPATRPPEPADAMAAPARRRPPRERDSLHPLRDG